MNQWNADRQGDAASHNNRPRMDVAMNHIGGNKTKSGDKRWLVVFAVPKTPWQIALTKANDQQNSSLPLRYTQPIRFRPTNENSKLIWGGLEVWKMTGHRLRIDSSEFGRKLSLETLGK